MSIELINMLETTSEEEWCVTCDKDDSCNKCDASDVEDSEGGWCIFHDDTISQK